MSAPMPSLFQDRFRDLRGWLLDALPWPLRRLWLAAELRSWPSNECRLIGFRRPPESVFDYMRGLDSELDRDE